jgi:hypothetical protein
VLKPRIAPHCMADFLMEDKRPEIQTVPLPRIAKKTPPETQRHGENQNVNTKETKEGKDCQNCDDCQESPKLKRKTYRGFTRMNADGKAGDPAIGRSGDLKKIGNCNFDPLLIRVHQR